MRRHTRSAIFSPRKPYFNPAQLFAGGWAGGFYDLTNPANLYADTGFAARSTVGGTVQGLLDSSPNANHLTKSAAGAVYSTFANGSCVDYNGSTPAFSRVGVVMGGTQGFTLMAACRTTSADGNVCDAGDYGSSGRLNQGLRFPSSTIYCLWFASSGITAVQSSVVNVNVDTIAEVCIGPQLGNALLNGHRVGTAIVAGNPAGVLSSALAIGATFAGTTSPSFQAWSGRLYMVLMIHKKLSDYERIMTRQFMAAKIGMNATNLGSGV